MLPQPAVLQPSWAGGTWQALEEAISEVANNGDVRLSAGPWQSGWWEGEDPGDGVLAWASGGTKRREGDPSAAQSLGPLLCGHQLQVQAPCTSHSSRGMPALKPVTQVMPTHRLPRARTEYPPRREEHGDKHRFLVPCQCQAWEGCCYPAVLQNITLEEEWMRLHELSTGALPVKTGICKSKTKNVSVRRARVPEPPLLLTHFQQDALHHPQSPSAPPAPQLFNFALAWNNRVLCIYYRCKEI